ncbi:MAG TPA: helix-turn-helix domain-containing protein [Chloroflexota bacterium]|nr:helix-turn-helix domain-containing protein [Chloroflexota bacterium]
MSPGVSPRRARVRRIEDQVHASEPRISALIRDEEILLSFNEAAAYLRASRSTLYRLMHSGQLVGRKVGRKTLFFKGDLMDLLRATGVRGGADGQRAQTEQNGDKVD